jgi:molybdopterin biosynthesis enzyme
LSPLAVKILPWHGSADLAALAGANGFARLGTEAGEISAGTTIRVLCL